MEYFTAILLLVFVLCYYSIKDLYEIYVKRLPPGPLSLPLIGGLHHLNPTKMLQSLKKLSTKYGKIVSVRMGPTGRMVFINDLALIKKMGQFEEASNRPPLNGISIISANADGLGSVPYGQKWRLLTKYFHNGITRTAQSVKLNTQLQQIMQVFLESLKKEEKAFDPRQYFMMTSMNFLTSLAYGYHYTSWDDPELQIQLWYHYKILAVLNGGHPLNLMPWIKYLPIQFNWDLQTAVKTRDEILNKNYRKHLDDPKLIQDVEDVMDAIVHTEKLVSTQKHHKKGDITLQDLFLTTWTIFLAGSDTLRDACLWITLYMCLNPDIQHKVQEEVDSVAPDQRTIDASDRGNLPYTEATVMECMRLSPPVALGIPHYTSSDITLGGYTIPEGTIMLSNIWAAHRDPKYWPDPLKLDPTRFLDKNGDFISLEERKVMPFVPFGYGKRTCLGKDVVPLFLVMFLSNFLQQFNIELADDCQPDMNGVTSVGLTTCPFEIKITPRDKNNNIKFSHSV